MNSWNKALDLGRNLGTHHQGASPPAASRLRRPYRGINVLLLWDAAFEKGFTCNIWMTYKQATELEANVKKGEKGTIVVYANNATNIETDEDGTEKEKTYLFLKSYVVFNVEQIEGSARQFQ